MQQSHGLLAIAKLLVSVATNRKKVSKPCPLLLFPVLSLLLYWPALYTMNWRPALRDQHISRYRYQYQWLNVKNVVDIYLYSPSGSRQTTANEKKKKKITQNTSVINTMTDIVQP